MTRIDFEAWVQIHRDKLRATYEANPEVPVDFEGVRVDERTHRFDFWEGTYTLLQDQGNEMFSTVQYIDGKIDGKPLIVQSEEAAQTETRPVLRPPDNIRVVFDARESSPEFEAFIKAIHEAGEKYHPEKRPELTMLLLCEEGGSIRKRFVRGVEGDEMATARKVDEAIANFFSPSATAISVGTRIFLDEKGYAIWHFIAVRKGSAACIAIGPFPDSDDGPDRTWRRPAAHEITVLLAMQIADLRKALVYGMANQIRVGAAYIGDAAAPALPNFQKSAHGQN